MAKNKVILGHLSGSAVFLNPVCMIVTKMHFKEPDEGIIISKETIHTWEFVTDEATKMLLQESLIVHLRDDRRIWSGAHGGSVKTS